MNELLERVGKLLSVGDFKGAEAAVAAVAPDPASHALGLALLALAGQDANSAVTHAERAASLGAGASALHLLATAKLGLGDPQGAIDQARKAVALDGGTKSRASLGSILLAAQRPEDAIAILRQVATEDPTNHDIQYTLGLASSQVSDYGEAITAFAKAFDKNPNDARPIQHLITMFAEVGRWLGALSALELSRQGEPPADVAVTLDLVMVHLYRLIAVKYPQRGVGDDPDAAVAKLMTDAARRSPAVQLVAARTLVDVGRLEDARVMVERLQKINLDSLERANLSYLRGYFAEQARDHAGALVLYEEALAGDRMRGDACVNALSLLLEQGTPAALEKIGQLLERVAPGLRGQPELSFNEAVYLARTNRIQEARVLLERLARLEHRLAPMARRALDELGKARA